MKLDREVDEMKRLLTGYLRQHRVGMVLFPVFAVIYTAVLFLFRVPAAVNLYALALCAAAGLAATAWDFSVYVRRHRILLHMEKEVTDTLQHLPLPKDLLEEDYQNIIRAAFQNDREKAFQADRKYTDMLDYFTMWAHQIKTPISALKLLIQSGEMDEETRGSLLDQLFRIEQYVEMVLCYVRLSGQVSDYIIAEYDLDDIIRQAVRKYAPVFIRSRCRLVYEPLNRTVLTDEKWLVFVIEQILSNSLKYTEAAGTGSVRGNLHGGGFGAGDPGQRHRHRGRGSASDLRKRLYWLQRADGQKIHRPGTVSLQQNLPQSGSRH